MSAIVISVINYKGGVGKTVSTYNIGFGLAFLNSHKVLLVDLDPQCSLTTICFKALSKTLKKEIDISHIEEERTINSIIKDYLSVGENNPNIDLNKVITSLAYTRKSGNIFSNVDFIPATMFDNNDGHYEKGLDDLEIDIVKKYANQMTHINLITLFSRFFKDTGINDKYDFIIFDCPPANNIITQNALSVSDYYLVPTLMDSLSSNGINHLKNLIEKSIFEDAYNSNKRIIDRCDENSPYACLKNGGPKMLGIFETLRKTQVKYNSRALVEKRFGNLLFDSIIYNHKPTADSTSAGTACFSLNINEDRPEYSPHENYGKLTLEILNRLGIKKQKNKITTSSWL